MLETYTLTLMDGTSKQNKCPRLMGVHTLMSMAGVKAGSRVGWQIHECCLRTYHGIGRSWRGLCCSSP